MLPFHLRKFHKTMSYSQTDQIQNKELHDMVVEIANYCKNKEVEGMSTKKKLTSTGGKYKWTDGEEVVYSCTDNVEFKCGFISFYEDTNSYKQKDLLVNTDYFFKPLTKTKNLDSYVERFAYLKGKLRKIRIHKLLNTK
jgi:hypothetical protein